MQHAKLSPSSSARWLSCTGSVKAEQAFPSSTTSYAAEGTTAHALAELCLTTNDHPTKYIGQTLEGHIVDEDMAEHIAAYCAYVKSYSGVHLYEHRFSLTKWIPDSFGTSDAVVIDEANKTAHIIDLKYGKGVSVDAEQNTQAMLYALGVIDDLGFMYEFDTVVIHIYQPRIKNYSSWQTSTKYLLEWVEWVSQRAKETQLPDAPRTPSEKACQWCKAKATCKALLDHTHNVIMNDFDDLTSINPDTLTDNELRVVMDNAKLIKSWLDAVEAHIFDKLNNGQAFDGYKLVEGRSTRTWQDEQQAAILLADKVPSDKLFTQKLISPAQAEKLLKNDKELFASLVTKSAGKPTLVPSCDKRIALNDANVFDALD